MNWSQTFKVLGAWAHQSALLRRTHALGTRVLMVLARPVRSVGGKVDLGARQAANRALTTVDSLWTGSIAAASAVNQKLPC